MLHPRHDLARPGSSKPSVRRLYLRLSLTDRCNYRCRYCMPSRGGGPSSGPGLGSDALLELVVHIHRAVPLEKIRLSGGEPLLHAGLIDLVCSLRARLPRANICLTTNGSRLSNLARPLQRSGLDAINISLDTIDPERFARLTGGASITRVLEGLEAVRAAGIARVKLNTVLQRSCNGDQLCELVRLAAEHGVEIRFIELMPIGAAASLHAREFLSAQEAFGRLTEGLVHLGELPFEGTARRHLFQVEQRETVVGFITPVSEPFCSMCNRIRLDSSGWLYSCLRRGDRVNLADLLHQGREDEIPDRVLAAIGHRGLAKVDWPARSMSAIGG